MGRGQGLGLGRGHYPFFKLYLSRTRVGARAAARVFRYPVDQILAVDFKFITFITRRLKTLSQRKTIPHMKSPSRIAPTIIRGALTTGIAAARSPTV